MTRKDEKPAAIYIGGIAAKRLRFRSRAVLLTYLKEHMKRERETLFVSAQQQILIE